jgi:curli biogenesis system outer membrane secretion channel CsgG
MAERLGQRLVESGHYRVLDSELLTREPSGARPGVVPLQAWRDRAERAGVSYLLIGSVTQYSKEERRRSGGGATAVLQLIIGARLHVPIAGAGRSTQTESIVGVSVRLIDVHSGEILTIANGEGIASRTDRAGGGFGAIHGLPIAGGFSDSRSGAATAMLDEAVRHAVDQAAESITKAAGLLPQSAPRPNLDGAAR